MRYLITIHDGEEDDITSQDFDNYDDAYELLEEIYGDMCCSDADYEDRPYYEIVEIKDRIEIAELMGHKKGNGIYAIKKASISLFWRVRE